MSVNDYVHGYSAKENERLRDQATTLAELLHYDTFYPEGSNVLEAGCGVGAQTIILAVQSPKAHFTSVDISRESVETAQLLIAQQGVSNVTFRLADLFDLPFEENSFDHIFLCFVLEHLRQPLEALERLQAVLRPGGTIAAIEGDHASAFFFRKSLRTAYD